MANEDVFSSRAENYAKGRFGYAQGVMELLCGEILSKNDVIADVGSGTGIFAKELMGRGHDVFCVEPNAEMRARAEGAFAGNAHFISVAATAEETTLPAASVDLVTAASAFHWFDAERFCAECRRILKPGGILFTVANARDYTDEFTRRQHDICQRLCPGFTSLRHGIEKSVPQYKMIFGAGLHHAEFDFPLEYTKERFVERSLSSSYAPEPNTVEQKRYIQELWRLMDRAAPHSGTITVPNVSVVYWGRLRGRGFHQA